VLKLKNGCTSEQAANIFHLLFEERRTFITGPEGPTIAKVMERFPFWKYPDEVGLVMIFPVLHFFISSLGYILFYSAVSKLSTV
jgi:hypothetical protein